MSNENLDTLEDLIRDLARRGEMTHLSLTPRKIERNGKSVSGWACVLSPASVSGNFFGEDLDPVDAIKNTIRDAKLRRRPEFKDGDGAKTKPSVPEVRPKKIANEQDLSDILG